MKKVKGYRLKLEGEEARIAGEILETLLELGLNSGTGLSDFIKRCGDLSDEDWKQIIQKVKEEEEAYESQNE